jgi:uncharacterized protein (DUF1697 family)
MPDGQHGQGGATGGRASLLRGINVGGHHQVPMARLRALYERLGFEDVQTYIQSGNVAYRTPIDAPDGSADLEAAIETEFGWPIRVLERTHADLVRLIEDDPFPTADPAHRHIMFLFSPLTEDAAREYALVLAGADEARLVGAEMHLHCPDGLGRTPLFKVLTERRLGVQVTTRNMRTVSRMLDLTG